jgi:hypothetical protein
MPIFSITHHTNYQYQRSVAFGEHRMMLRPRDDKDQKVIHVDVAISPNPLPGNVISSTTISQSRDFPNNLTD